MVGGAIVYDWVNGAKFLVRNSETGLTGNVYTGLHEFADMAFVLHVLRPADLFVDVGATTSAPTPSLHARRSGRAAAQSSQFPARIKGWLKTCG